VQQEVFALSLISFKGSFAYFISEESLREFLFLNLKV